MPTSEWFGAVTAQPPEAAPPFFAQLEVLLARLQPAAMDRRRSNAQLGITDVAVRIAHATYPRADIELNYSPEGGGIFSLPGFEEYYGDYGEDGPLEHVVLDDVTGLLTNTYAVEETLWRGRVVKTEARGEAFGGELVSHSGWLVPPRWLIPDRYLTTRSLAVSYGAQAADLRQVR